MFLKVIPNPACAATPVSAPKGFLSLGRVNAVGLSTRLIVSAPVVESETPAPALGISAPGSCVTPGLMDLFTAKGADLQIYLGCKSGLTWSISTAGLAQGSWEAAL